MVHETVMVFLVGLIRVMSRDKVSGIYWLGGVIDAWWAENVTEVLYWYKLIVYGVATML